MNTFEAIEIIEGGCDDVELTVEAWQLLIDTGIVWQLQGFYGRTAAALIQEGVCIPAE